LAFCDYNGYWPYFLVFDNATLPKVSFGLAITGLGISISWMCLTMCNNTKNEMESKLFKLEIQTQLDRIENQIKNKD
jgi:hypothetical protein